LRVRQTLCHRFSAALCGLSAQTLPPEVLRGCKRALLDALGSALAGQGTAEVAAVTAAASAWRGAGTSTVWGSKLTLNAPHAALVNGTAVHAREVDDFGGCGHSGAVVVPAALGAAELRDVSGVELLVAICAGYEAAARVINLVGGYADHNAAGWHGTGTCGVFGSAAATARILGLGPDQTAHALALAGTYTGGIWSFITDGAMSKRLHAGKAAEGGLVAALLAQQGMTGPSHLFDGGWGSFSGLYSAGKPDAGALERDFGQDFMIYRSGFKPYACCRGCHSALDAVLSLRQQHGMAVSDIERVTIRAPEQTARQLGKQDVENILDAQMSLPFSVAVALRFGRADLEHFQPPHLTDPTLIALAHRVFVQPEPARPTGSEPEVELHLRHGASVSATVPRAKGDHSNPMSDQELERKFFALAGLHFDKERAGAIATTVWGIERLTSMRPLLALLAAGPSGA
jgi:2-methylcitrate dehydratase PrpD